MSNASKSGSKLEKSAQSAEQISTTGDLSYTSTADFNELKYSKSSEIITNDHLYYQKPN